MTFADYLQVYLQIAVGFVLLLTLFVVLWYTWEMRLTAKATITLAEVTAKSRLDSMRPILIFRGQMDAQLTDLVYGKEALAGAIVNIGKGPALDVHTSRLGRVSPLRDGELCLRQIPLSENEQAAGQELVLELTYKDAFGNRQRTKETLARKDANSYLIIETIIEDLRQEPKE